MSSRAFISYAHEDEETAKAIALAFERNGWEAWRYVSSLKGGERFLPAISAAIEASDVFVLVGSNAARGSRWVPFEAEMAVQRFVERGRPRVLPVCVGEPCHKAWPGYLRGLNWIEAQELRALCDRVVAAIAEPPRGVPLDVPEITAFGAPDPRAELAELRRAQARALEKVSQEVERSRHVRGGGPDAMGALGKALCERISLLGTDPRIELQGPKDGSAAVSLAMREVYAGLRFHQVNAADTNGRLVIRYERAGVGGQWRSAPPIESYPLDWREGALAWRWGERPLSVEQLVDAILGSLLHRAWPEA